MGMIKGGTTVPIKHPREHELKLRHGGHDCRSAVGEFLKEQVRSLMRKKGFRV